MIYTKIRDITGKPLELDDTVEWGKFTLDGFRFIDEYLIMNKLEEVTLQYIKEKFGSLRIAICSQNDFISGMVYMMEAMSGVHCEKCNNPGTGQLTDRGWYRTLCDNCRGNKNE